MHDLPWTNLCTWASSEVIEALRPIVVEQFPPPTIRSYAYIGMRTRGNSVHSTHAMLIMFLMSTKAKNSITINQKQEQENFRGKVMGG